MIDSLRITRIGCLAFHLMPEYHGAALERAVKRIVEQGPRDKYEREAVRLANLDDVPDEKIKEVSP